MTVFRNIKGDLSGALSAAIIMLPMSIGYGIIAYSPLGMEFAPSAALLGIYSGVLCCIIASLLGGTPIQISGPKAPLTLALGAVVSKLVFDSADALPHLIVSGLIIGLIGSMESLLSSVVSDNLTSKSHNSRKELIGQGAGNIACAIAGGLPGAGSIPRSIANYKAGGRTRLSGIFCGLMIFAMVMLFGPLIGKIPLSVIAGIIIVVGYTLFDRWSFGLIRKVFSKIEHRRAAVLNLSLTAAVMVITISVNLIAAVVIGIIIASALFILKLGKSIVRREYTADQFHSRKMRNRSDTEVLEKYGRLISVVELQGPLFFGSAENLAHKIDRLLANSPAYFILDMKRVNEIDSTGARIIMRIKKANLFFRKAIRPGIFIF